MLRRSLWFMMLIAGSVAVADEPEKPNPFKVQKG